MTADKIWKEYTRGKDWLEKFGYYDTAEKCYNYYVGNQWAGLKSNEDMPMLNIIKPIVDYKVSVVNSDGYTINYTSMDYSETKDQTEYYIKLLNNTASQLWERLKMDSELWEYSRKACVYGDAYIYFFHDGDKIQSRMVENTAIMFADEQQFDLQKQKYILIIQRKLISEIKREAELNGVDPADIIADKDTQNIIGVQAKEEVEQDEDGKAICIKRFWLENGELHYTESTRNTVYIPERVITGMEVYPIARLVWQRGQGIARGIGEVQYMIPNQTEINKSLARQSVIIKQFAFPHIVYDKTRLDSTAINALNKVGSAIGVDNNAVVKIKEIIDYLYAPTIPGDSFNFSTSLATQTRELAGASESATGQINPERASGAAIIAVQEAAALPLSTQESNVKQFIEDIANIWLNLWAVYTDAEGLNTYEETEDEQMIPAIIQIEAFDELDIVVKVDVSPANPYSKFSREQTLENLLQAGHISFEEYVKALPDDAAAPKATFEKILSQRGQGITDEMLLEQDGRLESQNATIEELLNANAELQNKLREVSGGVSR